MKTGAISIIHTFMRWRFPVQNNAKNLDLSYEMDLDFSGCFGGDKTHLTAELDI